MYTSIASTLLSGSEKMDALMALAGRTLKVTHKSVKNTEAVKKAKNAILKAAPKPKPSSVNTSKSVPVPKSTYTSKVVDDSKPLKPIAELADQIQSKKDALDIYGKDVKSLRSFVSIIMRANQALKRNVIAKNPGALDVLGVFSEFRIPRELTDLGAEGVSDSIRTRVSDSVYRNSVRDFVSFVTSKNYVMKDNSGISTQDISEIISGVRAARALGKKYEISSLPDAIRQANALDEDISKLSGEIKELESDMEKITRSGRVVKYQVSKESVIDSKKQEVKQAQRTVSGIESDIAKLQEKMKLFKDMGNLSVQDAALKVMEFESEIKALKAQHAELAKSIADARKEGGSARALNKVMTSQKEVYERRRAEKLIALQNKYSGLPKQRADESVKRELAAWEKVEKEHLKARNEEKGYLESSRKINENIKRLDADMKTLDDLTHKISDAESVLSYMRSASKLTAIERGQETDRLSAILSKKKQELRNAAKTIKSKTKKLELELDPEAWEAEIDSRLEDEKFRKQAKLRHPAGYLLMSLHDGARTRETSMIDFAWRYYRLGKQNAKPIRGLKTTLKTAPTHFGASGFVVDPRYKGLNAELITVIDMALNHVLANTTDSELSSFLVAAVLDTYANTPEAQADHHKAYLSVVSKAVKWLKSPKASSIVNEIVEELIVSGKIKVPDSVKVTKRYIATISDNLISVIENAKAFNKLASFTWAGYRASNATWIRTQFKTEHKRTY